MRKILITTGNHGGPQTYVGILKEHLSKGHRVRVIAFDEVSGPKGIKHFLFFLKILKESKGETIIFAQDPVSVGLPSSIASLILGKKLLLKIVGDYAWEQGVQRFGVKDSLDTFVLRDSYGLKVRFFKYIQKKVALGAVKIIVPSNYLKGVVSKWGVDQDKIIVIENSFKEKDLPTLGKEELRKKLGFESNEKIVISVGRLVPWKGFEKLIESMDLLDGAKLILVGDGPERKKIERLIEVSGAKILYFPKKGHGELLEYIKASDVFVLNTGYEGLSHLLIEAMALGTPIATTSFGGNSELLENGKSALFFEYNDADDIARKVSKLLKDTASSSELERNAKTLSSRYREGNMVPVTINLINKLYNENS